MDATDVQELITIFNKYIENLDIRENSGVEYAQLSKSEYYAVRIELKRIRIKILDYARISSEKSITHKKENSFIWNNGRDSGCDYCKSQNKKCYCMI